MKNNFIFIIFLKSILTILFVFVLLCILYVSTNIYAKYISKIEVIGNSNVADFNVYIETSNMNKLVINKNNDNIPKGIYSFMLCSESDVNIKYDMIITFDKPLPKGITLQLVKENEIIKEYYGDNNVNQFEIFNQKIQNDDIKINYSLIIIVNFDELKMDYYPIVNILVNANQEM